MTPKEKAIELVEKFFLVKDEIGLQRMYRSEAINCSLILIDEIIKQVKPYENLLLETNFLQDHKEHLRYCQQIKEELIKL
jgi:hypothetical protein